MVVLQELSEIPFSITLWKGSFGNLNLTYIEWSEKETKKDC